jgi:diguanylate cyclase (GGDEF)-like protein
MIKAFLVLLDNQTVVKKMPLTRGRTVIGRGNDVDFILSSSEVSRHHAAITYDGKHFILTDLDSTNGTYVNGTRIRKRKIGVGENISIGDYILVIDDGTGGLSYPIDTAAASTGADTVILERKFASLREKLDSKTLHEEFRTIERAVKRSRQRLADAAHVDRLTGLFNRHYFEERAQHVLTQAQKTGEALALLFIDIDHFKKINDTRGHEKGDVVLASVARLIRISCRKTDVVARYGGEEIVVMLRSSSRDDAHRVARAINRVIRERSPKFVGMRVTVSIGIATYPADGTDLREILASADKALYRAKKAGRDMVYTYDEERHT